MRAKPPKGARGAVRAGRGTAVDVCAIDGTGRQSRSFQWGALLGLSVLGFGAGMGCTSDFESCSETRTCEGTPDGSAGGSSSGTGGRGSTGGAGSGGRVTTGGAGGVVGGGGGAGSGGDSSGGQSGAGGGDGGVPDSGDAAPDGPPPCDGTLSPSEDSCVLADEFGVFVSPAGSDTTGDGTKANPFATIENGLTAASSGRKRVYACADGGAYAETITVGATLDGSKVFGGLACADFSYTGTKAVVESPDTIAWKVEGLTAGLVVEDLDITAADATTPGGSSIGMLVGDSEKVVLRRVKVTAGLGRRGADGDGTMVAAATGAPGNAGTAACTVGDSENPGGPAVESTCGGALSGSRGGIGGNAEGASAAGNGTKGQPDGMSGGGPGFGQTDGSWTCDVGPGLGGGRVGANGTSASSGDGAIGLGTLSSTGFTPSNGESGGNGTPGQGGGGGGGAMAPGNCTNGFRTGASGGSGGGGGCGGRAGAGGRGGGSSFAIVSLQSEVTLEGCELIAQAGGRGGNGGQGQPGGSGGARGEGGTSAVVGAVDACAGGIGGRGGDGGHAGGGAGGHSVGIAYVGMEPMQLQADAGIAPTTIAVATPTVGGTSGSGSAAPASGAGVPGLASPTLGF